MDVLVVDDVAETRETMQTMLEFEEDLSVVGEASTGEEAVDKALQLKPDVILMDINLPGRDGLEATKEILAQHQAAIIIVSVESDREYFRRALQVGACDFLIKPFSSDSLHQAIRSAYRKKNDARGKGEDGGEGELWTVFSAKGGVGKSTIATNLAVTLGKAHEQKAALVDFDLELGTLHNLFGWDPKDTIIDLCRSSQAITPSRVKKVLANPYGLPVDLLPAPPRPDLAAEVVGEGKPDPERDYVAEIVDALKESHRFVIADTATGFNDLNLYLLDNSDRILFVATPEIPTVENTGKCLDILVNQLGYSRERVLVVLNKAESSLEVSGEEISHALNYPISFSLPKDDRVAIQAANIGQPFAFRRKGNRLSKALEEIASQLVEGDNRKAEVSVGFGR